MLLNFDSTFSYEVHVDFGNGNTTSNSRIIDIVFLTSNAEVTAYYNTSTLLNQQSGAITIPAGDKVVVPAVANISCLGTNNYDSDPFYGILYGDGYDLNEGFMLAVEGEKNFVETKKIVLLK